MTTHFTATGTTDFDNDITDIDGGPDSAANTAYSISLATGISVGNLALTLPQNSTLEIDGPGFLVIASGDSLTVTGGLTLNAPVTGDIVLSGGALTTDPVTSAGGIQGGGALGGSVTGLTATDSVVNGGTIITAEAVAVHLTGGTVSNRAGGSISGGTYGVALDTSGALTNGGTVSGSSVGASFTLDGTITNSAGAVISGSDDGLVVDGGITLVNAGTIGATNSDAVFAASGTVINGSANGTAATIQTTGFNAVEIDGAGSVTNDGSIISTDITGVYLGSGEVDNGLNAATAVIRGAEFGVLVTSGAGVVKNDGAILLSGTPSQSGSRAGVVLQDGGTVINGPAGAATTAGASITGVDYGIVVTGAAATVDNTGSISGGLAVDLEDGGTVVNGPASGVGTITGTSFGVRVIGSGVTGAVTNEGSISGQVGVDFFDANGSAVGTLVNGGTIASTAGATGTAVRFGSGAERLVLQSGYAVTGIVQGGTGAADVTTLELASGTGGAFTGLGGGNGGITGKFTFQNIGALDLDSGSTWSFSGAESVAGLQVGGTAAIAGKLTVASLANDGGSLKIAAGATLEIGAAAGSGNTISMVSGATLEIDHAASFGTGQGTAAYAGDMIAGFGTGSFIDLNDIAFASAAIGPYNATTNVVQVSDGTHVADLTFAFGTPGLPSALSLHADGNGGTLLESVACYCAGTLIAAPAGEVPVEQLRIGDMILTADGRAVPIRWIGRRSYAGRLLAGRKHLLPIRIHAGALGDGLPRRDLLISPSHAMVLDGMLVPAAELVDGHAITQERHAARVDYFHLELDRHEAIIAEGAASESFLDDDSRAIFQNAHEVTLDPQPHHPGREPAWCLPRVTDGYALDELRRRLAKARTAQAA